jgi:acyl-CoA thioester hydrolase
VVTVLVNGQGGELPRGIYRHRLVVPAAAVDGNGHVNNVQYIQWMQDAAVQHSANAGCTRLTEAAGATWVARSHTIEYLRPAYVEEQISVLTWVADFRKVRSLRKYRFFRDDDGALLARGETSWVFVDLESGKPRNVPAEVAGCFILLPSDQEP